MKTFKIYLLASFFLLTVPVLYAQDEVYNEKIKSKKETSETIKVDVTLPSIDEYYTEKDFYAKERKENKNQSKEIFTDEEFDHKERRKRNGAGVQIAADIMFEVIINVAFVLATFW